MDARDAEMGRVSNNNNVVADSEDSSQHTKDVIALQEDEHAKAEEALPPVRLVLLVMIAVVQGYTLIGPLQHSFKMALHISDTGTLGHVFTQAAAFVQWGKFAMTLGQNVVLGWCPPLLRVCIAMVVMMVGCLIPPLFVYALGSHWLGWVFISFGCIGMALGVFECTFLNVITPLGPLTKSWAIMGFPAAFFIINVFGMSLVSLGLPEQVLFWYIFCAMPIGMALFVFRIAPQSLAHARPAVASKDAAEGVEGGVVDKQATVWRSMQEWQCWLPHLIPFMMANIVGHFVMEGALPANFNTFNAKLVPLLGRTDMHLMEKNRYFVVFFIFVGAGDMLSRRVGYCFKLDTYVANFAALVAGLSCCVLGMYLTTLGIAVLSWLSAFLAFWGQGFNYAVASKYIDKFVPREHNLAAYSFWMFAGSAGAIAGSTMVDVIRQWICQDSTYQWECLRSGHH